MSTVTVDEAELGAEVAALQADMPIEPAAGPVEGDGSQPGQAITAAEYEPVAHMLFEQVFATVCPAWGVTFEETSRLAKATATALQLWFPDQAIPPKYFAILGVAGAAWGIAAKRRDPKTGAFLPRKLPDAKPAAESATH